LGFWAAVSKHDFLMKALVCTTPGQLEYDDIPFPEIEPGFSLIKIKNIGICGTDLHAFEGTQPFFEYPRILGHELSAEYLAGEAAGFLPGDAVTIIPYFNCSSCIACRNGKPNCCVKMKVCGVHQDGGMVEVLKVPNISLLHGGGLSFEELALVEPLSIGAHAVSKAAIRLGEYVLVMGAGPIGFGIIEFAKIKGANVIVLDINEQRLHFCRKMLGIQHVVNASEDDTFQQLQAITNGDMPTVVIDATGNLNAINAGFKYIAHGGRYILVGLQKKEICFMHSEFHKREATLMSSRNAMREDFEYVIENMRAGKLAHNKLITHRVLFKDVKRDFSKWIDPASGVIKAIVSIA
jgi:2-desacetyl-2-hydroxyethyl bacteriochlorophyllide A dehydrogenase